MPSFTTYKNKYRYGNNGRTRLEETKDIIEHTWNEDTTSVIAYFYDYWHDDQFSQRNGYDPAESSTKTKVDIKFIINTYQSLNKDQVDYHIMFKPSYECNVPYYHEQFEKTVGGNFPVGLYLDIQNSKGVWCRWLVVDEAMDDDLQFPKWSILPCDYKYQWIYDNKKYEMWGCMRSQSSYNAGVWSGVRFETVQNQNKFILPYNEYSQTIYYNQRLIISAPLPAPITWRISKVESLNPNGVITYTIKQDLYDETHDYIEKDTDGNVIGMWADFYQKAPVTDIEKEDDTKSKRIKGKITYSGKYPQLKVNGGYKKFIVTFYRENEEIELPSGEWSYSINGKDCGDVIESVITDNVNKLKFTGNDEYIGSLVTVKYTTEAGIEASLDVEVVGL